MKALMSSNRAIRTSMLCSLDDVVDGKALRDSLIVSHDRPCYILGPAVSRRPSVISIALLPGERTLARSASALRRADSVGSDWRNSAGQAGTVIDCTLNDIQASLYESEV